MNTLKYIRVEGSLTDSVFLFPKWVEHAEVANSLGYPVQSAGFVSIQIVNNELDVTTYGKSVSLGMDSNPADAVLVKRMLTTV